MQTQADKFLEMRPVSVMEKSSTPVSGTTPRIPAVISRTGTAKKSVRITARKKP